MGGINLNSMMRFSLELLLGAALRRACLVMDCSSCLLSEFCLQKSITFPFPLSIISLDSHCISVTQVPSLYLLVDPPLLNLPVFLDPYSKDMLLSFPESALSSWRFFFSFSTLFLFLLNANKMVIELPSESVF